MSSSQLLLELAARMGWLAAVGLTAATIAVAVLRHTARQTRLIELTLVALLLAPVCAWLPGSAWLSIAWNVGWSEHREPPEQRADEGGLTTATAVSAPSSLSPVDGDLPELAERQETSATVDSHSWESRLDALAPANSDRGALDLQILGVALALVYGIGVVVCVVRWLAGVVLVTRLRASATAAPPALEQVLKLVVGGEMRLVGLMASDRISQPIACGVLRPTILWPRGWYELDADTARGALAHECAHIAHADLFWLQLQALAQSLYWPHPAIWWLGRRLRLNQDLLADSAAARCFTSREDYAAILVQLAQKALGAPPAMAAAWLGSVSTVRRRVCRLLASASPSDLRCGRAWTVACLTILVPIAAALGAVRLADEDSPQITASGAITINGDDNTGAINAAAATINSAATDPEEADPETAQLPIGTIRHNTDGSLTFVGEVIDEDTKEPIPGAIVSIRQELPTDSPKASDRVVAQSQHKTDARGRYHFNVAPDHARDSRLYMTCAGVTKEGYAPRVESGYSLAMILKNRDLGEPPFFTRLKLKKGAEIWGQLVYTGGRPAPNVPIDGYVREGSFPEDYGTWLKTRTDTQGRFKLTVRQKGGFFLRFYPADAAAGRWVVADGRRGDLGTHTLAAGQKLRGRLLDAAGQPLAEQWVQADEQADFSALNASESGLLSGVYLSLVRSALTDAEGRFELAPLPPGKYKVSVVETAHYIHSLDRVTYPLKAVVLPMDVELTGQDKPVEVELRGVQSVEIVVQYVDGQGKPRSGWELILLGHTAPDKNAANPARTQKSWFSMARADASGRVVFRAPRGLTNTKVQLIANEHSSVRWSRGIDGELNNTHYVQLGDVTADVTDLVIHRYVAPVVLATLRSTDGAKLTNVKIGGNYAAGRGTSPGVRGEWVNGTPFVGDTVGPMMTRQPDGRYRSECMLPDEETSIDVTAEGPEGKKYTGSIKLALPEGATREVEIEMRPVAAE
ncbi:MAG: hypothetical protein K2Y37_02460 [Pirellulales bacterium]|nr:hypothetical protein [Pirellulales bacterium]